MQRFHMLCRIILVTLLLLHSTTLDAAQTEDSIIHTVQAGENLFRISLRYRVSMDAIMAASGLTNAHTIFAGQQLVIPLESAGPSADQDGSDTPEGHTYIVQQGDTLTSVALAHHVSIWLLVQANHLSNPHTIYTGQRLTIPAIETATPDPEEQDPAINEEKVVLEAPETYVVEAGDTLYRIAQNHDTTVAALAYVNGITNPSAIFAGQVLYLMKEAEATSRGSKHIVVDLSEQHLYAYQDGQPIFSFIASSGAAPSYTRTGEFHVQSKIPNAYGAAWNIWMPHWLGIYWAGSSENGIHALPILSNGQTLWAGYLGTPISYGCIVLGTYEATLLYDWAEIGTPVTIQP